jgi:hypothetical protein
MTQKRGEDRGPVEIYVTDDTIGRYFRRYQLAFRMLAHGARAQTVSKWSGLTRDQLVTLRRRWRFNPDERRRGPAPTAIRTFFGSRRLRSQAALFAALCRIVGVRYDRESPRRSFNLENGELLCEALEAYREWQPGAPMGFEHAELLAGAVAQGHGVTLGRCLQCRAAILIDLMAGSGKRCGLCRGP